MKHFLYLRIVATVILVAFLSYMIYFISHYSVNIIRDDWKMLALNEFMFALFTTNSLSVLFMYYKYYPDKEIPKAAIRFYWFSFVVACLCFAFMMFIFFSMLIYEMNGGDDGLAGNERHWQMVITLIIEVLLIVQLTGSRRMIRTIRKNVRQRLENSFA